MTVFFGRDISSMLLIDFFPSKMLSASSDHTIRLWSLGQQRCISTIEIHNEGVWTMCVNDAFNKVYSGGKDCRVYATDLKNLDESLLVCEDTAPILSVILPNKDKFVCQYMKSPLCTVDGFWTKPRKLMGSHFQFFN